MNTSRARSNTSQEMKALRARVRALEGAEREREQVASVLRQSQEQIELLLNCAGEGIYGIGLDGCCTFCNPACVRLLGYQSCEDLIGKNMHALIHHTRSDGTPYPEGECQIYKAFRQGVGIRMEEEVLWRADGSSFCAEYRSFPIRAGENAITGAVVTFVDISERKQAEAKNRLLMHHLDERVKELTALHETARILQNPKATPTEVVQKIITLLPLAWQHSDVAVARFMFDEEIAIATPNFTLTPWVQSTTFTTSNGKQGVLEICYLVEKPNVEDGPFYIEERHLINSVGEMLRAYFERKQAEHALQQSEEKYREIFEQAVEGIFQTTPTGRFINVNPALARLYGYLSPMELIQAVTDIGTQLYADPFRRREFIDHLEEKGIVTNFESQACRKDGSVIWTSENARAVRDSHGTLLFYEGFVIDISARKQAEELLTMKNRLQAENLYLKEEVLDSQSFGNLIGQSSCLRTIEEQTSQVAQTDASVLIFGESGTGKELVAREIHKRSHRRDRPMICVSCASIPKELYESEFFGHVKGAFTGAVKDRVGRFEAATGGTLFLDEVGELSLEIQAKLLRVLQEQAFERVGSCHTMHVDVRVIAATNQNLAEMVQAGRFRSDLFYRLNIFPMNLPPLRNRMSDIPLLVKYFCDIFSKKFSKPIRGVSSESMTRLMAYSWPGNIRELMNIIERAAILSRNPILKIGNIPDLHHTTRDTPMVPYTIQEMERIHILQILEETNNIIAGPRGAAIRLGLNPNTLRSRMQKLGIKTSPQIT